MTNNELWQQSAVELSHMISRKDVSSREVTDAILARIDETNPTVNAIVTRTDDLAREQADAADAALARGESLGPLHGIPYTLKDLTATAGIRTSMGSKLMANLVPTENNLVAQRMADSGGVLLGKTNTPEMGCKGVTDNKVFGITRNPWDLDRTPGGSSGGASAAVASGMGPLAEGSDFAGSIRIPAGFTGLVGFKPSNGRVPRVPYPMVHHPIAFCNGPIARTVADAALMLQVLAGPDVRDPYSLADGPHNYPALVAQEHDISGLRIGYSADLGFVPVEDEVRHIVEQALETFTSLGCSIDAAEVNFVDSLEAYGLLNANMRAGLVDRHYPERADDMDPLIVYRAELSKAATATDVALAEMTLGSIYQRTTALLEHFDVIITPTTPVAAFPIGIDYPSEIAGTAINNPFEQLGLTYIFNMTGHPAISVPAGWTAEGLPIGLQIVGRWRDDEQVLKVAAAYEKTNLWHDRWPSLGVTHL